MSYKGINLKRKLAIKSLCKKNTGKYSFKKNSNVRIFATVFTLLIILLLGFILPKSAKANTEGSYRNYFYQNVINNALSVIKCSNTKQQDASSAKSMQLAVLSFLGVDIINPTSIVVKEIAFLDKTEANTNVDKSETFSFNPFKLDDKQISKSSTSSNPTNVVASIYNPELKGVLNKAKPRVLIYHSHTSEAYSTSDKDKSNTTSSSDQTRNVSAVGDVIAEDLEKNYGISVIHDKSVNDKPDYTKAYKKSGVTLDKYLKLYEKFDLIIDLHRDSIVNKNAVLTKINGENVARFMFVVTDKNPRYVKQKKLIDSMIGISNKLYPGLIGDNPIYVYQWGMGFYNQNRSDNAVLIEVGTYTNTVQEVKNTGKYLSRIIAEQLNGKK